MPCNIIIGNSLDELKKLPSESVNCCITSPPYWHLRDYQVDGQIGLEETPQEYIAKLVEVFREVKRVLKVDGTLWINIADTYAANRTLTKHRDGKNSSLDFGSSRESKVPEGLKPKDLIGIPWRLAFALQDDGWYLRQDIIWNKSNAMPEPVKDRCTKSHEYIFLLSKSAKYYFNHIAIQENVIRKRLNDKKVLRKKKRNKRSVWTIPTKPFKEANYATFPPDLIRPCVLAGCPVNGTVLDIFAGSGTTGLVSIEENRNAILIELKPESVATAKNRISNCQINLLTG